MSEDHGASGTPPETGAQQPPAPAEAPSTTVEVPTNKETAVEKVPELKDLNCDDPSPEQREAWNKEYGRTHYVTFPGIVPGTEEAPKRLKFWYRQLKRSEYKQLLYNPDLAVEDREDEMCQMCLLWPLDISVRNHFGDNSEKAGIPSMLSEYIMDQSGFVPAIEVGNG